MNTLKSLFLNSLLGSIALLSSLVFAHEEQLMGNSSPIAPDSHAPIGVMGDHMHKQGEWMISYRFMQMNMKGNLLGDDSISTDTIVSQISNPNAPPATLRVAPLSMTTGMHMLGLMYAPSDSITLMLMLTYLEKRMDHQTYQGMMGTNKLGQFTTQSSGIGDTKVAALWDLFHNDHHKFHLNFGLSLPTGSIDETAQVLTPMNTRPTLRMPYAMQLGSGTYDLEPGLTYSGHKGRFGWGAQYIATLRLGENSEGYTLGDKQRLTAWSSYRLAPWVSGSLRLAYSDVESIDGRDSEIAAPVSTANPENYGGERLDLALGLNLVGQQGAMRGHRLAVEYQTTLEQDVNGLQLEMQSMFTLAYQYAF